ncbi:MAG: hypothetical protein HYZ91_05010 [Candidatus Omnitrophica bacterium]|nr:hypothetical protein [Candidatus Omnitrophota bacterium]
MRLSQWMCLLALVVGLGCLQVGQRNALFLKGYAVGERVRHLHEQETEFSWLRARVAGLVSPVHLAQAARDRRLKLVAWSTFASAPLRAVASRPDGDRRDRAADRVTGDPDRPLTHLAAVESSRSAIGDDSSD